MLSLFTPGKVDDNVYQFKFKAYLFYQYSLFLSFFYQTQ